jgi:hypothetical protein
VALGGTSWKCGALWDTRRSGPPPGETELVLRPLGTVEVDEDDLCWIAAELLDLMEKNRGRFLPRAREAFSPSPGVSAAAGRAGLLGEVKGKDLRFSPLAASAVLEELEAETPGLVKDEGMGGADGPAPGGVHARYRSFPPLSGAAAPPQAGRLPAGSVALCPLGAAVRASRTGHMGFGKTVQALALSLSGGRL